MKYERKSIFKIKLLDLRIEISKGLTLTAFVYLAVYLLYVELLLAFEEWLEHLVSVLVEDVSTGTRDDYLGEELEGNHVLFVLLEVLLQVLSIFAQTLYKAINTVLNWM